jgi:hypothetical protein
MSPLAIDSEFQALCPPLSCEEQELLEASLLAEGCWDELVVWRTANRVSLLDGHNRYALCVKHGLAFRTVEVPGISDRDAAKAWILTNQLGRRNLRPEQAAYLRGKRYELEKRRVPNPSGRNQYSEVGIQNGGH